MAALRSCWTLALLRLLSALDGTWSWTPTRMPYSLASSYLNAAQRPLWILEDELMKRQAADRQEANDNAIGMRRGLNRRRQEREQVYVPTAITIRLRSDSSDELVPKPMPPQARPIILPHRLQLPSHYMQQLGEAPLFKGKVKAPHSRGKAKKKEKAQRRRQPQSLPIFDSAPGDNALPTSSYPIFVYNGSRGELLLNTMLSARRYPMQEPVPGQVLYPPSTPMFRPKPIVERLRLPGKRELLNLTLIPFYAHEAITPTTIEATTGEPSEDPDLVVAATESEPITTPMPPTPNETQLASGKRKRKSKKAKQYSAYHSPQEVVQWQPELRTSPALEAPDNHRQHEVATTSEGSAQQQEEQLQLELQTGLEEPSQELQQSPNLIEETTSSSSSSSSSRDSSTTSYSSTSGSSTSSSSSSSSSFQIIYVDESLESPSDSLASTTAAPPPPPPLQQQQRHSSRFALKREYFAFPVYTLGKLLQHPHRKATTTPTMHGGEVRDLELDCSESSKEHSDHNTWFILNSRYKGPHHSGQSKGSTNYYTSKYIQSPSSVTRT
ncbi:uncharacterized protein LOC6569515 [Drosophila grimshawi]|uniref:GH17858 n=1 Tax=Drosophila grimshawi TaxID=7222 RepID=B4JX04_DROGR|nr:uncharacterized protein LOC6569515 [Drosophila grimshawi]EDV95280.1 GH17858 [Drosophila grimshawi]